MKPAMTKVFQFATFSDWVNTAQRRYEGIPVHLRPGFAYDAKGRRCWKGLEMQRARDEGAFPVRVFIAPQQVVEPFACGWCTCVRLAPEQEALEKQGWTFLPDERPCCHQCNAIADHTCVQDETLNVGSGT